MLDATQGNLPVADDPTQIPGEAGRIKYPEGVDTPEKQKEFAERLANHYQSLADKRDAENRLLKSNGEVNERVKQLEAELQALKNPPKQEEVLKVPEPPVVQKPVMPVKPANYDPSDPESVARYTEAVIEYNAKANEYNEAWNKYNNAVNMYQDKQFAVVQNELGQFKQQSEQAKKNEMLRNYYIQRFMESGANEVEAKEALRFGLSEESHDPVNVLAYYRMLKGGSSKAEELRIKQQRNLPPPPGVLPGESTPPPEENFMADVLKYSKSRY